VSSRGLRNGDTAALDGLTRTAATLDGNGVKEVDLDKLQERAELGQVAGQVGFRAASDFISSRQDEAASALAEARLQAKAADASEDPEAIAQAQQQLQAAQSQYAQWDEGGTMKRATQAATGAVAAAISGGNVGAAALGVMANEILLDKVSVFLNEKGAESGSLGYEVAMALSGAASGALGGAVAGDVSTGASVGAAAQQYG